MAASHDIEVRVTFLGPEESGRSGPVRSGYRPTFHFNGMNWDANYVFPDVDEVGAGESARAYLEFLHASEIEKLLYEGMPFLIREGGRIMGYGAISKILSLAESAERQRRWSCDGT